MGEEGGMRHPRVYPRDLGMPSGGSLVKCSGARASSRGSHWQSHRTYARSCQVAEYDHGPSSAEARRWTRLAPCRSHVP